MSLEPLMNAYERRFPAAWIWEACTLKMHAILETDVTWLFTICVDLR